MDTDDVRTWFSGIAGIVGLWLLVSPFFLEAPRALLYSNVAVGALVAVLAAFTAYRLHDAGTFEQYAAGLAGLGGGWALLSPFVLGAGGPVVWSNAVVGTVVLAVFGHGLYVDSGVAFRSDEPPTA